VKVKELSLANPQIKDVSKISVGQKVNLPANAKKPEGKN
jgi:hypothetical protein